MALIPFPPLEPLAGESGRELKLGKFPNRRYDAPQGGSSTVRGFGSLSYGQQLTISFGIVTDQEVSDVWLAWDAARGDYGALALPDLFFFGIDPALLAKIPENIEWHFEKKMPNFSSVGPGLSKLDPITFVGQLALRQIVFLLKRLAGAATGRGRLVGSLSAVVPPTSLLAGAATGRGAPTGSLSAFVSLLSGVAIGRGELVGSIFDILALGPVAWWDFGDPSTVGVVSGRISTLYDKSGNGWDLEQATPDRRPIYVASAVNGRGVGQWTTDKFSDVESLQSAVQARSFTFAQGFFVIQHYTTALNMAGTIFSFAGGAIDAVAADSSLSASPSALDNVRINGGTVERGNNVFPEIASPCLVMGKRFSPVTTAGSTTKARLGAGAEDQNGDNVSGWDYRIMEVILFDNYLSPLNESALSDHLIGRWGI